MLLCNIDSFYEEAIFTNRLFLVPGTLSCQEDKYQLDFLVDTGATGYAFINKALVPVICNTLSLDPLPLAKPKRIRGFDGVVRKRPITHAIYPTLQLDGYSELTLLMLITDLGSYSAILGKPWMKKAGCLLDMRNDSIIWPDKLASMPKLEVRRRPTELAVPTIPAKTTGRYWNPSVGSYRQPLSTTSPIETVPSSNQYLKPSPTHTPKGPPKLLRRPTPEKEDAPFDIYSIRAQAFGLLAKRAKQDSTHVFAASIEEIDYELALHRNLQVESLELSSVEASTANLEDVKKTLLKEYYDFLDVFDRSEANKLPPHRPSDHKIEIVGD